MSGGMFPAGASPCGGLDPAGNGWEWCQDVDDPTLYERVPSHNPRNTLRKKGAQFVVRGGSWYGDPRDTRASHRPGGVASNGRSTGVGFRCVREPARES